MTPGSELGKLRFRGKVTPGSLFETGAAISEKSKLARMPLDHATQLLVLVRGLDVF
ncbi:MULTISPECIES: hypothetical protein [Ferrimicrobium]|uniref:Uncharacterized protein n=1 Tax=Ferrimicrobium acidiphilum TaxID=121039 RepID=A0ABV3Y5U8_9ACTN|nr:hypothetical protein [Ferrimicrobium sp.]